MVCISLHRMPLTAGMLLLAASIAPFAASSQNALPFGTADQQRQLADTIDRIKTQEGPYSPSLLGPFMELALLYRESGNGTFALATIEQALHVVRATYGLRSFEQAPLLRQKILLEQDRGNVAEAWRLEQELLTLLSRHPADLRTVPMLHEIADKRIAVLERYLDGEFRPEIVLGCFYDPFPEDDTGSCTSGSKRVVVHALVDDAATHYFEAIKVLLRNDLYASGELRELETQLMHSSYSHGEYRIGRASVRRLISYEAVIGAPPTSQMDLVVQLADWDLLFATNKSLPLDLYERVHERLKLEETGRQAIDRIFSPEIPVVLPAFLPNPLVPDETKRRTGYIDVAFELTKFGQSRDVKILGASGSATDAAKEQLVQLISTSRFRPRLNGGQFGRTAPITVRYQLTD